MRNLLQKQIPHLRISHQSETLKLRKELALLQSEFDAFKKKISNKSSQADQPKIVLPLNGKHVFIERANICYCEAYGAYTKVFVQSKNKINGLVTISCFLISKTLKSIITIISSKEFIRCHQSYLVNKNHVTGYEFDNGLHLNLSNDKRIPVSRRNKKEVLEML